MCALLSDSFTGSDPFWKSVHMWQKKCCIWHQKIKSTRLTFLEFQIKYKTCSGCKDNCNISKRRKKCEIVACKKLLRKFFHVQQFSILLRMENIVWKKNNLEIVTNAWKMFQCKEQMSVRVDILNRCVMTSPEWEKKLVTQWRKE